MNERRRSFSASKPKENKSSYLMFAELMNGNECIVDGYRTEGQATRRGAQAKQEEATERRPEDARSGREHDRKRRHDVDDASPRF